MEKTAFKGALSKVIKSPITAAAASLTAGGTGGFLLGKKKGLRVGAETMADELGKAFVEANIRENKRLHTAWQARNKVENKQIAQHYLRKGFQMGQAKTAGQLDEVYTASFEDEMQKLASDSSVAESFIGMDKEAKAGVLKALFGGKKVFKDIGKIFKGQGVGLTKKKYKTFGEKAMASARLLGKKAPGTLAAGGLAAGYGTGKLL